MGKMKFGNPAPKIKIAQQPVIPQMDTAMVEEILNKHADTFRRLAESEAKDKILANMQPVPTIVKQEIIHVPGVSISKPDHRARKYTKELNTRLNEKLDVAIEMIDDRLKHSAIRNSRTTEGLKLMTEANQICHQKMNELNRSIEELKTRKPEEKQIVIEKPVTNKLVILGLCASLVLNVLILIIK